MLNLNEYQDVEVQIEMLHVQQVEPKTFQEDTYDPSHQNV